MAAGVAILEFFTMERTCCAKWMVSYCRSRKFCFEMVIELEALLLLFGSERGVGEVPVVKVIPSGAGVIAVGVTATR